MRKVLLAATLLAACSTSVEPTNPYDAQNPGARAPVAVTVAARSDDPLARPGWVSCAAATATPCRVNVTLTADASPAELQLSTDPAFAGAAWVAVPPGPQPWTLPFDVPDGADGPVTVHARFRSAAGNVSATFADTVQRKSSPPAAPSVSFPSLVADGGASYTNVLPLPVALSASGADRMRVSCDVTQPLAAQPWLSYNPSQTCVLVAGDGDRVVSASFVDEAGNESPPASATVRLQQTPPPPPVVTLSPASGTDPGSRTVLTSPTTALTSSLQLVVQVNAAAAGALFSRLDASSSAFLPAVVTSTSVAFTLAGGDAVADATNLLSVRTVDRAGNVSQPATVTVVQERSAGPAAPTGLTLFTRPGSIQVGWTESVSRYTAGYQLSYGPTPAFGGTGADQGASPIQVGTPCDTSGLCRYVLTGLSNFEPQYLAVTATSDLQAGGTASAGAACTPQPAGLALVGTLATAQPNLAVAVADDRAYVVQSGGLQIVDLSAPAAPVALGKATFPIPIPAGGSSSVAVRWPYAYVAGVDGMYVFDVRNEAAPAQAGFYQATHPGLAGAVRPVVALALRWPRAYLHVSGRYWDVGALLDVVDVSTPTAPVRVNYLQSPSYGDAGYGGAIEVVGATAFFGTAGNHNVRAANVGGVTAGSPPTWYPSSTTSFSYTATHLAADLGPRRLVYAMEGYVGTLRVLDYSNVETGVPPVTIGVAPGVPGGKFAVAGGDVFLASDTLLEVLDLSDPGNPRAAGTLSLSGIGSAGAVAVSGPNVVVAGSAGLAVVSAVHAQYPQARGQAAALGNLSGGARVEVRGRIAVVPGNGIALLDVGDPAAPRMVASNQGSFVSGNDYALGYGWGGGAALAGDLLFSTYATASNSGSGLMAWALGAPFSAPTPGPGTSPCGVARSVLDAASSVTTRYYGLAAHGGHLFAARGGSAGAKALDVYDLSDFTPLTTCAYGTGFAAGPAPRASFGLAASPRDVQVHRRWAFVGEVDGLEILDVSTPTAPVQQVRQAGLAGVSALSARLGRCAGTPCYQVFVAASGGVRAYTWLEGAATVTDAGWLSPGLGAASAVLAAHGLVVQGTATTAGLGFFDASTSPASFQSYSTPQPSGAVYAIGAAGRYVYANDGGSLVVQELQ